MSGKLYFVATPIGNLKDITYRAVETLKNVDYIACEDTRHSLILLNALEIKKPLISCHKFNENKASIDIIENLKNGKNIAYITDAGTPCISDPGYNLLQLAIKNNINYTILPGAVAFVNALVLSGFDNSTFVFAGFLPDKNTLRKNKLNKLKSFEGSVIFYSAPHDINKDIKSIYSVFGQRKFAAVKEITKIHERVIYGNLDSGINEDIKGEYVLIVKGAEEEMNPLCDKSITEHINFYLKQGIKQMDAVKQTAKDRKMPKSEVYKYTIEKD